LEKGIVSDYSLFNLLQLFGRLIIIVQFELYDAFLFHSMNQLLAVFGDFTREIGPLVHLLESLIGIIAYSVGVIFLLGGVHDDIHKLRLSTLANSKLLGMAMDESLDFCFQVSYPLDGEKGLKGRVLHGVRDIG
jgi:hypothetical protein